MNDNDYTITDLLDIIAERGKRIKKLEAQLDAKCDHSELHKEIERLSDENKRLVKADKHREKVWFMKIKELELENNALRGEETFGEWIDNISRRPS